ncbi:hypothetical protein L211DRAFT_789038, partial [Terfezia boudieri ATCC MYA-4762]
ASTSTATQEGRIQNIPALNAGQQIVQELRRMNERIDRMELRFTSISITRTGTELDPGRDHNSIARQFNSHAVLLSTQLIPLHNSQNQEVENFPANIAAIDDLEADQLTQLLRAYDQPTIGSLDILKHNFKKYLGILDVVPFPLC